MTEITLFTLPEQILLRDITLSVNPPNPLCSLAFCQNYLASTQKESSKKLQGKWFSLENVVSHFYQELTVWMMGSGGPPKKPKKDDKFPDRPCSSPKMTVSDDDDVDDGDGDDMDTLSQELTAIAALSSAPPTQPTHPAWSLHNQYEPLPGSGEGDIMGGEDTELARILFGGQQLPTPGVPTAPSSRNERSHRGTSNRLATQTELNDAEEQLKKIKSERDDLNEILGFPDLDKREINAAQNRLRQISSTMRALNEQIIDLKRQLRGTPASSNTEAHSTQNGQQVSDQLNTVIHNIQQLKRSKSSQVEQLVLIGTQIASLNWDDPDQVQSSQQLFNQQEQLQNQIASTEASIKELEQKKLELSAQKTSSSTNPSSAESSNGYFSSTSSDPVDIIVGLPLKLIVQATVRSLTKTERLDVFQLYFEALQKKIRSQPSASSDNALSVINLAVTYIFNSILKECGNQVALFKQLLQFLTQQNLLQGELEQFIQQLVLNSENTDLINVFLEQGSPPSSNTQPPASSQTEPSTSSSQITHEQGNTQEAEQHFETILQHISQNTAAENVLFQIEGAVTQLLNSFFKATNDPTELLERFIELLTKNKLLTENVKLTLLKKLIEHKLTKLLQRFIQLTKPSLGVLQQLTLESVQSSNNLALQVLLPIVQITYPLLVAVSASLSTLTPFLTNSPHLIDSEILMQAIEQQNVELVMFLFDSLPPLSLSPLINAWSSSDEWELSILNFFKVLISQSKDDLVSKIVRALNRVRSSNLNYSELLEKTRALKKSYALANGLN